ncbi:hypothetical protein [Pseudooceanicola aestuarii]|uniref:hypothetical protein n=1 Tax=Pseudooceanicola aestuarii TaxID=2697319 RepID=UPI0013D5A72E|nr:hypothetical protein [Pseudooceanicola aestuarii]
MPELSRNARSVVSQFAAGLGLDPVVADDGGAGFEFQTAGRLSFTATQDGDAVVMSLTRKIILEDIVAMGRFAGLGGYHATGDEVIQAGMTRADQPVLALTLPAEAFDLPRLERGFDLLDGLHRSAGL